MNDGTAVPVTRENLLGLRILAGIVDAVLMIIFGFVFALVFGESESDGSSFEISLNGLPLVVYIALSLGYYFVMESTRGQTLGKMAAKIRVVSLDGAPLTTGQVAVRTLLRFVDGFFFYLIAVIVIAVSKNQQRIGDMAAGTTVVRVGEQRE